eukprot:m.355157 g.355157  ORF g.355157 m.355157 type:complete len:175 (+) comp17185_c0_seq1:83-607(+)
MSGEERKPLVSSQPVPPPASQQQASPLTGAVQVVEGALPEYDFTWTVDPSTGTAHAHLERGNIFCLFCFGAFAQCCCMYAEWEVYLVQTGNQVQVSFGKSDDQMCIACCLGGAIGAGLTSQEYSRVVQTVHGAVQAYSLHQSGFQIISSSPPSYNAAPAGPPPAYTAATQQAKQ